MQAVYFYRALRAGVVVASHWTAIPEELSARVRYTRLFSSVEGVLGVHKCTGSLWSQATRIKKLVFSLSWFCKIARDQGYISAQYAAWTGYLSPIQLPFDAISFGFGVGKIAKYAQKMVQGQPGMERKLIKAILYTSTKGLDVVHRLIDPNPVHAVASLAVRIAVLFLSCK